MKQTLIYIYIPPKIRLINLISKRFTTNWRFTSDELPIWEEQSQDLMLRSTVSKQLIMQTHEMKKKTCYLCMSITSTTPIKLHLASYIKTTGMKYIFWKCTIRNLEYKEIQYNFIICYPFVFWHHSLNWYVISTGFVMSNHIISISLKYARIQSQDDGLKTFDWQSFSDHFFSAFHQSVKM